MSRARRNGTPPGAFERFEDLARRLFQVKRTNPAPDAQPSARAVAASSKAPLRARRFKMGIDEKELRCSFCGKDKDHVQYLLAGPAVFICGECVDKCVEIIDRTKASGATP